MFCKRIKGKSNTITLYNPLFSGAILRYSPFSRCCLVLLYHTFTGYQVGIKQLLGVAPVQYTFPNCQKIVQDILLSWTCPILDKQLLNSSPLYLDECRATPYYLAADKALIRASLCYTYPKNPRHTS